MVRIDPRTVQNRLDQAEAELKAAKETQGIVTAEVTVELEGGQEIVSVITLTVSATVDCPGELRYHPRLGLQHTQDQLR